jgi:hypothetical protein
MNSPGVLHWTVSVAALSLSVVWYVAWSEAEASDVGAVTGALSLVCTSVGMHISTFRWPRDQVVIGVTGIVAIIFGMAFITVGQYHYEILTIFFLLCIFFLTVRFVWLLSQFVLKRT